MHRTWGIILAAGTSQRMGRPKLLLPFGKSTILETALDNVLDSEVHQVMLVVGGAKQQVMALVGTRPVAICENDHFRDGMLSSVRCGIAALPEDAEAVLVYLADQPMITAAISNMVLNAWKRHGAGMVVPSFDGRRGHPLLIDLKYRDEIETLDPQKGLRELLHRHPDDLMVVEVNESSILIDIDTPEDYSQLTNKPE